MIASNKGKIKSTSEVQKKVMKTMKDKARKYFKCTDRERAAFEAGIKLGSIYHQFVGAPINKSNLNIFERAIEDGVRIQPFVEEVKIKIESDDLRNKRHQYDYVSLTGNMLNVNIRIKYNETIAQAKIKYIEELKYPLMFITSLK